jgi:Fe-S cluster assembly scaffold protein SufB
MELRKKDLENLRKDIEDTIVSLNIPEKEEILSSLEEESLKENFWQDTNNAKRVMSELGSLREEIQTAQLIL